MIALEFQSLSDGQYTLSELYDKLVELAGGDKEVYGKQHLGKRLLKYYGGEIVETKRPGHDTLYTLLAKSNTILCKNHEDIGRNNEDVVDTAAALVNDAIRQMVYENDVFPEMSNLGDTTMIPPLLLRLVSGIVQTKSTASETVLPQKQKELMDLDLEDNDS